MNNKQNSTFLIYDFGTSSLKAALYDSDMELLCIKSSEFNYEYSKETHVELEADELWKSLVKITHQIENEVSLDKVKTINITSNGETVIPVDADGKPLRKAMIWLDSRAKKQAARLENCIGIERFYEITGQDVIDSIWPVNKIRWIYENEPEIYNKTWKFLLLKDYIIYMLTGNPTTEPSISSCSAIMDITTKCWSDEILDAAGIDKEKLPDIIASNSVVGRLTKQMSKTLNIPSKATVLSGMLDQCSSAIGAGNIFPGIVSETTGTVLAMVSTLNTITDEHKRKRLPYMAHGMDNTYIALIYAPTAAIVLKWFKDNFCLDLVQEGQERNVDIYEILTQKAAMTQINPSLIISAYFKGRLYPENQPDAKGIISGITLSHTRDDFIRAIFESISFMLQENLDYFKKLGIETESIISLGGASKSKLWCQIKSDITNKNIITLKNQESTVFGAAISAAVTMGYINSYKDINKYIEIDKTYVPNNDNQKIYSNKYNLYKNLLKKCYQ